MKNTLDHKRTWCNSEFRGWTKIILKVRLYSLIYLLTSIKTS